MGVEPIYPAWKTGALTNVLIPHIGTPGGTRTPDTGFRRPVLYPTELLGHLISSEPLQQLQSTFHAADR